jgi:hypothetical protein
VDAIPSEKQLALYRPAFVHNCMILVVRAHRSLIPSAFQHAEEPDITGELVRAAHDIIESNDTEPWMDHLEVLDDPPQNVSGRFGKRRPRIDIEFVQTGQKPRPRFHLEAKRLYRSDSANEYFGVGGLTMLLEGSYAANWPSAGMLGYVQSDNCATWISRLETGLETRLTLLQITDEHPGWTSAQWTEEGLREARISSHRRTQKDLGPILIYHLLLAFYR